MSVRGLLDAAAGPADAIRSRSFQTAIANTVGNHDTGISPATSFCDNWQTVLASLPPEADAEGDASEPARQNQLLCEGMNNRNADGSEGAFSNIGASASLQVPTDMNEEQVTRAAGKAARLNPEKPSSFASYLNKNVNSSAISLRAEIHSRADLNSKGRQSADQSKIAASELGYVFTASQSTLNPAVQIQTSVDLKAAISAQPVKVALPLITSADRDRAFASAPMSVAATDGLPLSRSPEIPTGDDFPTLDGLSTVDENKESKERVVTGTVAANVAGTAHDNRSTSGAGAQVRHAQLENRGIVPAASDPVEGEEPVKDSQNVAAHLGRNSITAVPGVNSAALEEARSNARMGGVDASEGGIQLAQSSVPRPPVTNASHAHDNIGDSNTPFLQGYTPVTTGSKAGLKPALPARFSGNNQAGNAKHSQLSTFSQLETENLATSRVTESGRAGVAPPRNADGTSGSFDAEVTFSALESGNFSGLTLRSASRTSPAQAEAGYQDPSLGWIGVRAESNGGAIHAILTPSSPEAVQALSEHMAGLHTYLAENRTPIDSITVASSAGPGGQLVGQGSGREMNQGNEQQMNRNGSAEPLSNTHERSGTRRENAPQSSSVISAISPTGGVSDAAAGRISVMA